MISATSLCCGRVISDRVEKGIERMIGDNFDNMEKVVATPYPNKEVKVLSLEQLPKSYGFYDDEKIRVDRDMNKRYGGKIRVDFIENSKRTGFIKFKEGGEGYVYFDRLLTEAKL